MIQYPITATISIEAPSTRGLERPCGSVIAASAEADVAPERAAAGPARCAARREEHPVSRSEAKHNRFSRDLSVLAPPRV
jgi:hypothetical protein